MKESEILSALETWGGYHGIFIPQFTFGRYRIDAVIIDLSHRWIRGFEIKVNRGDFLQDKKWTEYSKFLSSLSVVCPAGLIQKDEVENPFGLIWLEPTQNRLGDYTKVRWVRRPKNFQSRRSLAWFWTYVSVIEAEFPRMKWEISRLRENELVAARKAKEGIDVR